MDGPSQKAAEWPKWVVPHESHLVRKADEGGPAHISSPSLGECHVNRVTGEVTVWVDDEAAEKFAVSELPKAEEPEPELKPSLEPEREPEKESESESVKVPEDGGAAGAESEQFPDAPYGDLTQDEEI